MDVFYDILKWILIVLAAGFVGQFGKSFSKYLIKKRIAKKQENSIPLTDKEKEIEAKLNKKKIKAELKAAKKNKL